MTVLGPRQDVQKSKPVTACETGCNARIGNRVALGLDDVMSRVSCAQRSSLTARSTAAAVLPPRAAARIEWHSPPHHGRAAVQAPDSCCVYVMTHPDVEARCKIGTECKYRERRSTVSVTNADWRILSCSGGRRNARRSVGLSLCRCQGLIFFFEGCNDATPSTESPVACAIVSSLLLPHPSLFLDP